MSVWEDIRALASEVGDTVAVMIASDAMTETDKPLAITFSKQGHDWAQEHLPEIVEVTDAKLALLRPGRIANAPNIVLVCDITQDAYQELQGGIDTLLGHPASAVAALMEPSASLALNERRAWRLFVPNPPSNPDAARLSDYRVFLVANDKTADVDGARLEVDRQQLDTFLRSRPTRTGQEIFAMRAAASAIEAELALRSHPEAEGAEDKIDALNRAADRLSRAITTLVERVVERVATCLQNAEADLQLASDPAQQLPRMDNPSWQVLLTTDPLFDDFEQAKAEALDMLSADLSRGRFEHSPTLETARDTFAAAVPNLIEWRRISAERLSQELAAQLNDKVGTKPAAERTGSSSSPILLGAAGGAGAGLILSLAAGGFGAVLVPIGAVGGAFVGSRQASSKALAAQQYNEEIRRAVQTILKRKLKEVRTSADRAKAEAESGLASVADQLSRTVLEVHTRNAGSTVEWRRRLADILKRAEIELKG